ncbi:CoA pyrophosphatase [Paradevosia shaoguanensis]|uniref:CoA pyrophosphatase n=1 Tax=Paradevosia shaoguanensis TaxID=1335043 RepID=UPI003C76889B
MLADDQRIARIGQRLLDEPEVLEEGAAFLPDWRPDVPPDRPPVAAAVLISLIHRPEGLTVLYTERSADLRSHSGQVAFPGGKIDPTDTGPAAAALREAFEEVGMLASDARILGFMPHYYTGSNYLITPVVAEVHPSGLFVPNPSEVDSLFEVPLAKLASEVAYGTFRVRRNGQEHSTLQIEHEGHRIWGITANLTRRFRDLALTGETQW